MTNPGDPTALLDRLDGELADLGARLSRVRSDLGTLRGSAAVPAAPPATVPPRPSSAPTPVPSVAPPPGPGPDPGPPAPPAPPAGLGPWAPWSRGVGPAGAPAAPRQWPVPRPLPAAPGQQPGQQPGRPPAEPARPPLSEYVTGARLLAATGAAVTLLGVVLLLVLAASRGWFGPVARVGVGGAVGLALVGAAVLLHRRRAGDDEEAAAADPGPVSLAATGILALYLTVAAAVSLYALLPVGVAVVLALLVAGGGLALADRWRRPGLALGVVVGADLLVPTVVDAANALLLVLLVVVVVVTLPVAARRAWPVLVAVGVGFTALIGVVVAADVTPGAPALPAAGAVLALLLVAAVAAPVLVVTGTEARTTTTAAGFVLAAPVLPLLAVAGLLDRPLGAVLDVLAVLALLGVGVVAERGVGRVPVHPVLATTALAAAAVVGFQAVTLALTGVAQGGAVLGVAVVLAVLARTSGRRGVLLAAGAFGLVGAGFALVRDLPLDVVVLGRTPAVGTLLGMSAVGVLLAAAAGTLLAAVVRLGLLDDDAAGDRDGTDGTDGTDAGGTGNRDRRALVVGAFGLVGLYGAAGLVVTLALAVSPDRTGFLVGHVLVTISWTALALVLLVRGVAAALPRVLGGVLVVAAVAKLILFDLVALDGLARVVVFLGAGLVLLVAGSRYARLVSRAAPADEPGTLAHHDGDGAPRSSAHRD